MDESSMITNRRSRRSPVLLAASVEIAGAPVTVKLRNLSEEGALIEGERLPLEGRYAGVAFDERLNPDDVLRNIPTPKPKAKVDFRRPGFASRPLTASERRMVESWMTTPPRSQVGE
jgi:hypothetical protein